MRGLAALSSFFAVTSVINAQAPVITSPQDLDIVATNEAFDPGSNPPWTTKALMLTARDDFAISDVNGKIYVAGGEIFNNCTPIDTLEAYDPATDTWTTEAPMPSPLRWLASAATINEIMYVVGGELGCGAAVGTVAAYDPSNDTWTTGLSDMPTARYFTGTAVIHDSTLNRDILYVIGGDANSGNGIGVPLNTVEAYDPVANSWTTKHSMSTNRSEPVVGVVTGKIYAIGGYDGVSGVDTVEEYDPATDSWAPRTSIPVKQLGGRGGVINDIIYVVGGIANSMIEAAVSTVQTYNPLTDHWSTAPNMPSPRTNLGVAIVNNKLYAVGGNNGGIARVDQPFIYQITATNHPTSYSASGLPADLNFDTTLGIIYGTPTSPSDTLVQFTATNGVGAGPPAFLRIVVQPALNPAEPFVISSNCATGRTNQPFSFQVLTENATSAAQLTAGGLPPGLVIDHVSGLISGTPTLDGNFGVSLGVTDGPATTNATLQLTFISDSAVPIINSSDSATLISGQPFSYTIMSDINGSFSYVGTDEQLHAATGSDGLPAGLMYDAPSHTISGTWSGGAAGNGMMQAATSAKKTIGRVACRGVKRPETIPIRPPRIATTKNIVNNGNGTGINPPNFFGGYLITIGASPSGGGTVNGTYNNESSATITATPNSSYRFVSWTDEDGSPASKHSNYTFTPTSNRALTAHFVSVTPTPTPRPSSTPKPAPTPSPTSTPRPSATPK